MSFAAAFVAPAQAHDFWLQPRTWHAAANQQVGITLQVGHGQSRQRSFIKAKRVRRFEAVGPNGRRFDLTRKLQIGTSSEDAIVSFRAPGTYLIGFETDNAAESHLSATKFNDYLDSEGLQAAIDLRAQHGRTDADGSENYSRHAKTIIQIGALNAQAQSAIVRPIGLKLEIVPVVSPQMLRPGDALSVRVIYRGSPLAGALMKLNDLDHDAQPIGSQRTDAGGRATFVIPKPGSWQLNVIWTRPQGRLSLNDFDTSFSSLSFGIGQ